MAASPEEYTIGRLARAAGVPTSTVRYYERAGLLRPDFRTGGNYRAYGPASLDRLRFIRAAQATGFSLADVAELLTLTASDQSPCEEVAALLRKRLGEVRGRLAELRRVEKALSRSLDGCCRRGGGPDWCQTIVQLQTRTGPAGPAGRSAKSAGRA